MEPPGSFQKTENDRKHDRNFPESFPGQLVQKVSRESVPENVFWNTFPVILVTGLTASPKRLLFPKKVTFSIILFPKRLLRQKLFPPEAVPQRSPPQQNAFKQTITCSIMFFSKKVTFTKTCSARGRATAKPCPKSVF